ncbi:MAG: hypothetical protein DHS20C18_35600 [Saprospiraceae bacterium]|nr:MAG: hypothetical protein DHS20C18_35600 [Saprospiraceae bacterium]
MKQLLSILLITIFNTASAQTFVGEISTPEGFQYMKLEAKADSTFISFPYEFRQTFGFNVKAAAGNDFTVKARAEQRTFTLKKVGSEQMELTTNFTGTTELITLKKQLAPIEETQLDKYTGNFIDENGNRAIVYVRRGYLHLMSPYAEQTVSLKPIGQDKFWSTSGETTIFADNAKNSFQTLSITNRQEQQIKLKKSHDYSVKEDWVMVDGDSIYVNIYIPHLKGKKPACLLLPGGGGQSQVENFEYEARFFAAHGMVAMTFDKASVGKSKGQSFEHYTFKEKALRYQQLIDFLKSNVDVDPKKVGIHGPSEGGRLALMMGINLGSDLAFINATAAPLMTPIEGQLYAANHYSRNIGMTEEDIVSTLMIWKNYYSGILKEKIDTTNFATIRELRAKYNRAFLPPTSEIIPLSPKAEDLIDNSVVTEANKLNSPVFLQYGENDERVNPMGSLQNFYQNISERLDVTAEVYKRGNHSMMTPEFQICSGYAYDKVKWLKTIGIIE